MVRNKWRQSGNAAVTVRPKPMVRILVVDDDPKLRGYVCAGLRSAGIEALEAPDGVAAYDLVSASPSGHFNLVLLDVMMPNQDGWQLLERLRAGGDETPAIFLTARSSVDERIKGLEIGADDYIIKPFAFAELMARIDAVLRRQSAKTALKFGPLSVDLVSRTVSIGSKAFELAAKEFSLLVELVKAGGEVVSRADLLELVWKIDFDPETNVVDVYIARLRRRLQPEGAKLIHTERGVGYYLKEDLSE